MVAHKAQNMHRAQAAAGLRLRATRSQRLEETEPVSLKEQRVSSKSASTSPWGLDTRSWLCAERDGCHEAFVERVVEAVMC